MPEESKNIYSGNPSSKAVASATKVQSNPRQRDALVAFVVAVVGTWLTFQFLLGPFLTAFGVEVSWWMYVVFFLVAFGSGAETLAKQRAQENLAYGPVMTAPVASVAPAPFCSQCGRALGTADAFCPGCGTKIQA